MLSHYVTVSMMDNYDDFYQSIIVDLPYICIIICPQWFLLNPSPVTENTAFLACERTLSKSVSRLKNRPLHHQSPSPGLRTDLLLFKSYWHEVPSPPFLRLHSNQHLASKKDICISLGSLKKPCTRIWAQESSRCTFTYGQELTRRSL